MGQGQGQGQGGGSKGNREQKPFLYWTGVFQAGSTFSGPIRCLKQTPYLTCYFRRLFGDSSPANPLTLGMHFPLAHQFPSRERGVVFGFSEKMSALSCTKSWMMDTVLLSSIASLWFTGHIRASFTPTHSWMQADPNGSSCSLLDIESPKVRNWCPVTSNHDEHTPSSLGGPTKTSFLRPESRDRHAPPPHPLGQDDSERDSQHISNSLKILTHSIFYKLPFP